MRRHFSFQRLAIVVVWAALSPQGALLVQNWTSQLLGADGFDSASVAGDFDTGWSRWSDCFDSIAKNTIAKNTMTKNAPNQGVTTEKSATEKTATPAIKALSTLPATFDRRLAGHALAPGEFSAAEDMAAAGFSGLLPSDNRRDFNLPGVVIR